MQLRAYTIYDTKALQYHSPWFASTDGQAVRNFSDLANDLNTQIGRHPADYRLYCIGTYDDSNARFESFPALLHIVDAQALLPAQGALPLDNVKPLRKEG